MIITLIIIELLALVGIAIWLVRLTNTIQSNQEPLITYSKSLIKSQACIETTVNANHRELGKIVHNIENPTKEPQLFTLRITDLDTGKSKKYEYENCSFTTESDRITAISNTGEYNVLGSHSLVNRQYDIVEF